MASAVLGQLLAAATNRRLSIANSLWYALNLLLPVSAFFLIFRYIAGVTADDVGNRVLLTISLVLIIYVVVAIFNAIFFGMASPESWRARTPKLLRDIILALLVMIGGGIVASQVWNQNVAGMFTALGIGSVILGFALQETLGNIMLGLSMLMERPYLEGDNVKIGGTEGRVEEINWRATSLRQALMSSSFRMRSPPRNHNELFAASAWDPELDYTGVRLRSCAQSCEGHVARCDHHDRRRAQVAGAKRCGGELR